MSILRKSSRKVSARRQIDIKGVRDNVLLLPDEHYRIVLQVSSVNFELKSEAEQYALIEIYQSFLNLLAGPLQVIVRVRETDMDRYLEDFRVKKTEEKQVVYRSQIDNYSQFVASLVTTNKILSRNFYIVVSYDGDGEFEVIKEQLNLNSDIVVKGLARMGMQSRQLSSLEILDLFYSFYNPVQAKAQPITASTMDLLSRSYI